MIFFSFLQILYPHYGDGTVVYLFSSFNEKLNCALVYLFSLNELQNIE